jgi:hypothetical protein
MCHGGVQLADFLAGTHDRPAVPPRVGESLTTTDDGVWLVRARKVARPAGARFAPLAGGEPYPADAVATCRLTRFRVTRPHSAPDPGCSCGFHALSQPWDLPPGPELLDLYVLLSGRVLAFEWPQGVVLFRAARQTVLRADRAEVGRRSRRPDDPEGRWAVVRGQGPRSAGPVHLALPQLPPPSVVVAEHGTYCPSREQAPLRRTAKVLTSA